MEDRPCCSSDPHGDNALNVDEVCTQTMGLQYVALHLLVQKAPLFKLVKKKTM